MVSVIADILKHRLSDLDWIERFGGLVVAAAKANPIQSADGAFVNAGYQYWPVACNVNMERCFEDAAKLKWFVPESSLSAVAFFVDNGGTSFVEIDPNIPKRAGLVYRFNLKFLCWMNLQRLGDAITNGSCFASGRVVPYVIAQFFGEHAATDVFAAESAEAKAYQNIQVTGVTEVQRLPSMFSPFTFAALPDKQAMFLWPYDYFGLSIQGTFTLNRFCLADLYQPPFVAETDTCLPGEPTDDYLMSEGLEHITSEEETPITID
jgi:hypothetical protein